MNINVNGKDYTLQFGLRFLDVVDKERGVSANIEGASINTGAGGMDMLNQGLSVYSPSHLATVIRAGTAHLRQRPSEKEIEDYIQKLVDGGAEGEVSEEYFDLYDEINDELGKNSMLQVAMKGREALAKKKKKA